MAERSADRPERQAAAAMRRLVVAHERGELSLAVYRRRRRQLLEEITRGRSLTPGLASPETTSGFRRVFPWLPAVAIIAAVVAAVIWWLRG